MIPRRFFWLFDFTTLLLSFIFSYTLVPSVQGFLASSGFMEISWIAAISPKAMGSLPPIANLAWLLYVAAPPTILLLEIAGRYGQWVQQSITRIILAGLGSPVIGLTFIALVPFALRQSEREPSRIFIFLFISIAGLGLTMFRLALRAYYRQQKASGYYSKNVVFIGMTAAVQWMTYYFHQCVNQAEYIPMGYLRVPADPARESEEGRLSDLGVAPMGDVRDLGNLLIHRPIHEVIAIQPASNGEWIRKVIRDCDHFGIVLRIVPEALIGGETLRLHTLFPFQDLHLPAVVLAPPAWDSESLFLKRLVDFVISALLLVLLSPLFLLIAVAIKVCSPRLPVFYRWRVVGMNGVEFTGYKFSSMVADADEKKSALIDRNEMSGPVFKIKNDPRVTPLGRFLRKFSLNELPQLWSVLKGDMSLVGPRPAFRHELERYEFWQKRKLSIRPGITCLWQIRGRNKISDFSDWVKMDLEYVDNWSLWLDVKILMRTMWVVMAGSGS